MILAGAIVCDAANIRDGAISMLSGGITNIRVAELPSGLPLTLAIWLLMSPEERQRDISLEARLSLGDESVGTVKLVGSVERRPGTEDQSAIAPVIVPLASFDVKEPGNYSLTVKVEGDRPLPLPLVVHLDPTLAEPKGEG
jgi:hypothetical protein